MDHTRTHARRKRELFSMGFVRGGKGRGDAIEHEGHSHMRFLFHIFVFSCCLEIDLAWAFLFDFDQLFVPGSFFL